MLAMYFHYAVVIYNGIVQPFQERRHHFFQQFNEVFVMWTILILMTFAGWRDRAENGIMNLYAYEIMGNCLIAVVVSNLLINMFTIIGNALIKNWRKYYIKYLVWKRKKLREKIEQARLQWQLE